MAFSSLPVDETKITKDWVISKKIINELIAGLEERRILQRLALFNFSLRSPMPAEFDLRDLSDASMRKGLELAGAHWHSLPYEDLFLGTKSDGTHPEGTFQVNKTLSKPSRFIFVPGGSILVPIKYNIIFWDKDDIDTTLAWKEKNVVFCVKDASLYWYKKGKFVKDEGENTIPIMYSDKIISRLLHAFNVNLCDIYPPTVKVDNISSSTESPVRDYELGTTSSTFEHHIIITFPSSPPQVGTDGTFYTVNGTTLTTYQTNRNLFIDLGVIAREVKKIIPDFKSGTLFNDPQAVKRIYARTNINNLTAAYGDDVFYPFLVNPKSKLYKKDFKEDNLINAHRGTLTPPLFFVGIGQGDDFDDIENFADDYYFFSTDPNRIGGVWTGGVDGVLQTLIYFRRAAIIDDDGHTTIPTTASIVNWLYFILKGYETANFDYVNNGGSFQGLPAGTNTNETPFYTTLWELSFPTPPLNPTSFEQAQGFAGLGEQDNHIVTDFIDLHIKLTPKSPFKIFTYNYTYVKGGSLIQYLEGYIDISSVLRWK